MAANFTTWWNMLWPSPSEIENETCHLKVSGSNKGGSYFVARSPWVPQRTRSNVVDCGDPRKILACHIGNEPRTLIQDCENRMWPDGSSPLKFTVYLDASETTTDPGQEPIRRLLLLLMCLETCFVPTLNAPGMSWLAVCPSWSSASKIWRSKMVFCNGNPNNVQGWSKNFNLGVKRFSWMENPYYLWGFMHDPWMSRVS